MADDDAEEQMTSLLGTAKQLKSTTDALGSSISKAFARGIVEGRRFEDILQSIGRRFIEIGLRAAFKPLESSLQNLFSSIFSGSLFSGTGSPLNVTPSAFGNVFQNGRVRPFAQGGVIGAPSFFPLDDGVGLMGERGAEAIMPLSRGADGKLGVRGGANAPVAVTVNVATQDAESFRRSETQIAGALARAVARGRRGL